jgi:ABC-type transporter Mla subunit MlaD
MSDRNQRFALGVFVFFALFIMAGLIIVFGSGRQLFTGYTQYTIVFTDAPGLSPGSPVRKSGVKVGQVSAVNLDNETGLVRIVIQLDPKFTPRSSDEPVINRGLITGDSSIDFMLKLGHKAENGESIPPGSTIAGIAPFNPRALVNSASDIVPEAQKSMEQLRKSLENLDKMTPQFQSTIKEFGELARAGREFIPELRRTNDAIRDFFAGDEDQTAPAPPDPDAAPPMPAGPNEVVAMKQPVPAPPKAKPPASTRELKGALKELKDLGPEIKKTTQDIRYFLNTATFWIDEFGVMALKNEPKVSKALDAFTNAAEGVNRTLSPENQKSITATLKNVENASAKLDKLSAAAEDLMKDGKVTMKTLNNSLAKADLAVDDIRQATKPLAQSVPKLIRTAETGVEQFTQTMTSVNELVRAIGKAEGTFQKFISDPSLYNNLNSLLCSASKLMPELEQILKDVGVFADKIARHPEALGVGGAVRPSSGIKESPASRVP